MCGIVGYFDRTKPIEGSNIIGKMTKLIQHRGPDDCGTELLSVFGENNDVAVGFTRLSILDISHNGHQPMFDANHEVCITFNGEIYNAFDYKRELEQDGIRFRSNTDTEIILYLYKKYGIEGMLKRLNGMFAFCIIDMVRKHIYVARDRMGIKPCYWYKCNNSIMWSSEIKTFYAHPDFLNCLNEKAIGEFFFFRYVAGEETLLKDVYNLLPGHYLKITAGGETEDRVYWNLPDAVDEGYSPGLEDYKYRLSESVKKRLLSDVELGVQLSGGVDSSLVLAYAKRFKHDVESYSIIFDDKRFSEKEWMDQAASRTKTEQHQYTLKDNDFAAFFSKTTWHLDAPLNHGNSIGIYLLCKNARQNVKVLLTGEGADELFGGYPRYARFIWSQENLELSRQEDFERNVKRYWEDAVPKFIASSAFYSVLGLNRILPQYDVNDVVHRRINFYKTIPGREKSIHKFLNYELRTYLVDILNRQDKMSMAASLETRVPFLDHTLVEFVRRQSPQQYVIADQRAGMRSTKIPLKRLAAKEYGEDFAYRPKSGFPLPLQKYFSGGAFTQHCEEVVLPYLKEQQILNPVEINALWKNRLYLDSYSLESSLWIVLAFGEFGSIFLQNKQKVVEFV